MCCVVNIAALIQSQGEKVKLSPLFMKLQISHNILDLFYLFIYVFILVAYEALWLF